MDKLNQYREIVKRLIKEYAHDDYRRNGADRELVFDIEIDFAEELVNQGVPKQDIVIGFYSPFMRKFTEYAVS
ncbi:MAG TPA: hypothetical protein DCZ88_08360 [Pseudanabaena sp.]|nr:hypothetical protein [Pseudanabaena sp.]